MLGYVTEVRKNKRRVVRRRNTLVGGVGSGLPGRRCVCPLDCGETRHSPPLRALPPYTYEAVAARYVPLGRVANGLIPTPFIGQVSAHDELIHVVDEGRNGTSLLVPKRVSVPLSLPAAAFRPVADKGSQVLGVHRCRSVSIPSLVPGNMSRQHLASGSIGVGCNPLDTLAAQRSRRRQSENSP